MLPLEGIRVVDFTVEVSGPTCGMLLADLGADTIKVERPGTGEHAREVGAYADKHFGVYFFQFNRNKRSLALDLKKPDGKKIFLDLARTADIVVENYSPGVVERLGIDYNQVKEVNPRIIYCGISGFGKVNAVPQMKKPAYNIVAMGEAGLLTPYDAHKLEPVNPTKPQVAFVDLGTGMYAALAILAALIARQKTGRGQYIDMSMMRAAISWREDMSMSDTKSMDNYVNIGPDRPFKAKDRWITISAATNQHFESLFTLLGLTDVLADPELKNFNSEPTMKKYRKFVDVLEEAVAKRDSKTLLEELTKVGVPCGRINTIDDLFDDQSLTDIIVKMRHPTANVDVRVPGIPYRLSETPASIRFPAPVLGQHSVEILTELGYNKDQIENFRSSGVIQ